MSNATPTTVKLKALKSFVLGPGKDVFEDDTFEVDSDKAKTLIANRQAVRADAKKIETTSGVKGQNAAVK